MTTCNYLPGCDDIHLSLSSNLSNYLQHSSNDLDDVHVPRKNCNSYQEDNLCDDFTSNFTDSEQSNCSSEQLFCRNVGKRNLIDSDSDTDSEFDTTCSEDLSQSSVITNFLSTVSLLDNATAASSAYHSGSAVSRQTCISDPVRKPTEFSISANQTSVLRKSLFPNVPPTVVFCMPGENVEEMHEDLKRVMKWQQTKTTPIILRKILLSTGFKLTKKLKSWIGVWGQHMKSYEFQLLKSYQKVNHFPGTFHIGRKDRLCRTISRMQSTHGKNEFQFVPLTFVLPDDSRKLWSVWDHESRKQRWIVKPPASARGKGIQVIHKFSQLPKEGAHVVQKYLQKPYLINGTKFDLRLYVFVASFDPLRIYIYKDGLVRFASSRYSNTIRSLKDQFIHLTNSSINKNNAAYTVGDELSSHGHKWTLKTLWNFLNEHGVDTNIIWEKIVDLVIKTIISCEQPVTVMCSANVPNCYNCYELFGFDVMLDESLQPWLLEVNISPSLHSSTQLDTTVKGNMLRDVLNLAGFRLPCHLSKLAQSQMSNKLGLDQSSLCLNLGLYRNNLSAAEKMKQDCFTVYEREKYVDDILENLTPNDVCHLVEFEDEITRAGQFERIFPSHATYKYHKFFLCPRYHTNLLDAWEAKYHNDREKGRSCLYDACLQKLHLSNEANCATKQTVIEMQPVKRNIVIYHVRRTHLNSVRYRWHLRNRVSCLSALHKLQRKRFERLYVKDSDSSVSTDDASV